MSRAVVTSSEMFGNRSTSSRHSPTAIPDSTRNAAKGNQEKTIQLASTASETISVATPASV